MAKRQILEGVGKNQTSFGRPKSSINGSKQKQDLIQTHRQYQSALFEINLAITSNLDLAAILDILMDKIGSLLANFASEVWLLDRESRQLKRMTSRNLDKEEWMERELETTPPLLKAVLEEKVPVFVSNIQKDPRVLDSKFFRKQGLLSYLGVPLIVKREVLGAITFMTREEHQFSEEETEFLSTLAGQAAIAIHNSQLHAQITKQAVELKKANEDLKRREAIQKVLKELSQDITSLDIDSLLKKLTEKVREVIRVDICDVRVIEKDRARVMGVSGVEPERIRSRGRPNRGRSRWIREYRRPLVIADITKGTDLLTGETTSRIGIHGYLGVPLFTKGGEVVGVMRALTYQPREFTQEEVGLIQQLANGAAVALENAGLLSNLRSVNQELERTSQEQTVLQEFLENLLFLDLDHLLQRLTEQAVSLFSAEFAWARLLDEKGRIQTGAVAGEEAVVKLMTTTEEKKLVGRGRWMLDNGKPLAVEDMAKDTARPYRAWVKAADLHGFLGAPLFSRDQKPLGVIHVMTRSPRQFSRREIDLVEQFANVAAIAIENGAVLQQLRERTQEGQSTNLILKRLLREQSSLREIITNINVMDRGELLKKVTEHALSLLKVDHALVRLLDADGLLQTVAYTGEGVEHYQKRLSESGRNRSGWVMENCRPLAIKDVSQDEVFGQGHLMREMGVKGFLMVPLVSRGQKSIGVLGVTSIEEREFTKDEIALTQQFAAGAAIAIDNANLFQESRRREEIQTLLKELSQDVTLLDIESLLKKLTERVREILRVDVSDVRLMKNGTSGFIGISGVEPERLQSERTGTVRGRFKWILENRKPLMIPDTTKRNDIPTGESVRRLGIRGYLGVPLFSRGGGVIGVLRALTYEPREFSQEEIDLLQHLTNEATIALENAKLLEEMRKQTEELKQSNRLKSEFLSIMSHELRTPLNAIVGYTEMIRDRMLGDINPRQGKVLEKVVLRSKDLLSMITSILQATSIEGGAIKVDRKGFDLNHFLDELKSIYDVPLGKELTLVWDYPRGLPFVTTDSEKLKCILQNLINNAIKFTDRGQVTVSARYLSESGKVGFEVADTGIGISQEALPAIFEMFRQVDGSETRAHGGVGLGLYIVKRLAKLLGGKVEVESEFGKGSAFTVTISSQN